MGNQSDKIKNQPDIKGKEEGIFFILIFLALLSKNHFDFLYVVGRGGFGKVFYFKITLFRFGEFIIKKIKDLMP